MSTPITEEKIGQIAVLVLQREFEKVGITLKPREIKRQIINDAKSLGITAVEMAECTKIVYKTVYEKTMAEIDLLINPQTDQVEKQ